MGSPVAETPREHRMFRPRAPASVGPGPHRDLGRRDHAVLRVVPDDIEVSAPHDVELFPNVPVGARGEGFQAADGLAGVALDRLGGVAKPAGTQPAGADGGAGRISGSAKRNRSASAFTNGS